jgi:hypothetical protein
VSERCEILSGIQTPFLRRRQAVCEAASRYATCRSATRVTCEGGAESPSLLSRSIHAAKAERCIAPGPTEAASEETATERPLPTPRALNSPVFPTLLIPLASFASVPKEYDA